MRVGRVRWAHPTFASGRASRRSDGDRPSRRTGWAAPARRHQFGASALAPVQFSTEDSPRGLWRSLGKRVGFTPSRVRISYPPPCTNHALTRAYIAGKLELLLSGPRSGRTFGAHSGHAMHLPAPLLTADSLQCLGRVSKVVPGEGVAAGVSVLTVGGLPG